MRGEAPRRRGSEMVKGSDEFTEESGKDESGEIGKNPGAAWCIENVST